MVFWKRCVKFLHFYIQLLGSSPGSNSFRLFFRNKLEHVIPITFAECWQFCVRFQNTMDAPSLFLRPLGMNLSREKHVFWTNCIGCKRWTLHARTFMCSRGVKLDESLQNVHFGWVWMIIFSFFQSFDGLWFRCLGPDSYSLEHNGCGTQMWLGTGNQFGDSCVASDETKTDCALMFLPCCR